MRVEAQATERTMAPVGDASLATIESLRARLLAERAASKEARDHAQKIALKVSELQCRLDLEIEQRKKAEVAMKEVLEVLRAKGVAMEEIMTSVTSVSVCSESDEAVQMTSSKDGESENSSGEDGSQIHSVSYQQDSVVEIPETEALKCQSEEGVQDEDSSSERIQIMVEDDSKSDALKLEKVLVRMDKHALKNDECNEKTEGAAQNEELIKHEQSVFTDVLDEKPITPQGESILNQPSEVLDDLSHDHAIEVVVPSKRFGPNGHSTNNSLSEYPEKAGSMYQEVESNFGTTVDLSGKQSSVSNKSVLFHASISDSEKAQGLPPEEGAISSTLSPSRVGDGHTSVSVICYPGEGKTLSGLLPRDMSLPSQDNTCRIAPNYFHPAVLTRGGYPYERLNTSVDPLQHIHMPPAEAPAPFSRGPIRPTYAREFIRYPRHVPMSEAVLSLVDDKNGKLGNILMALNLAKQQINDEDYATGYMEEPNEAAASSDPFVGKYYPGLYDGVPDQPPNRPWRFEQRGQVPIVHLPVSPRSDHEPSPFETHDEVGRNSSTYAYYMPGYDPYLQPKGELHLGNGITLYTD